MVWDFFLNTLSVLVWQEKMKPSWYECNPEYLSGFLFVSSACILVLIMHPGSQFELTNSWRDLVSQEEVGNAQPINLSIMFKVQQGWGEAWITPKHRLMSAGHSLPFFLSGRRCITFFFFSFFLNEQVSPVLSIPSEWNLQEYRNYICLARSMEHIT